MSDEARHLIEKLHGQILDAEQNQRMWASRPFPISQKEMDAALVRGSVTITAHEEESDNWDTENQRGESFAEFVAGMANIMASIAEEYRSVARIRVCGTSTGYDSCDRGSSLTVTYDRPETDEEWTARKADTEARAAAYAAYVEQGEREQLAALKAKYGG